MTRRTRKGLRRLSFPVGNSTATWRHRIKHHRDHVPLSPSFHRKRPIPPNTDLLPSKRSTWRPLPRLSRRPISFRLFRSANVLLRSCFWCFSHWRPLSRLVALLDSEIATSRSMKPLFGNCAMHSLSSLNRLPTRIFTTTRRSPSVCTPFWPLPPPLTPSRLSFASCMSMRSEMRIP